MTIITTQHPVQKHHRGGHRGRRAGVALSTGTVITAAVALIGGGSAFAYFTHTGSSAPAHATVDGIPIVMTAVVSPTGTVLYPGGPKGGFTITVKHGIRPVLITGIAADPDPAHVPTSDKPGCPGSVVTLTAQHPNPGLAVGTSTDVTKTYPAAVSMSASAPNACQGATFTIPVVLTGRSPS